MTASKSRRRPRALGWGNTAIRRAVADYMASEGCSCCQNKAAHEEHTAALARLLRVPMYADKSGYDFARFRTKKVEGRRG